MADQQHADDQSTGPGTPVDPMDFASAFKRLGSSAVQAFSEVDASRIFSNFLDQGFTGETYADFDKPLSLGETDVIRIIHFNDVYNIEQAEDGSGGISRFTNAMRQFSSQNPLILFSGDAFNPSILSTQTRGRHMIPFLNILKIHTACVGNHDFDFGVDQLEYLTGSTQFPWLLSNVFDAYSPTNPLANSRLLRIFEWQGHRIGVMGLVEEEWLATLPTIEPEDVIYVDFVEKANELSKVLRAKDCTLIIALTHMRAPNDERLGREAEDIDLILGGHDHEYYGVRRIGNSIVAKSGTDFREFTTLAIHPGTKQLADAKVIISGADTAPPDSDRVLLPDTVRTKGAYIMPRFCEGSCVEWERIDVSPKNYKSNRHVDNIVSRYIQVLQKQMHKIVGETGVALETRFAVIRTSESNMGNWLCDLMRASTKADFAVLNSGTMRSDKVFPPGILKLSDLSAIMPMEDKIVLLSITGKQFLEVLENSVSQYPKTEGRFLQVSGFKFSFDPRKEANHRLVGPVYISGGEDQEELVQEDKVYTLCTKEYIAIHGKDGYDVLKECKVLRDAESCPTVNTVMRNAFTMAAMANGFRKPHNLQTEKRLDEFKAKFARSVTIKKMPSLVKLPDRPKEEERYQLYCYVEGRIVNVEEQERQAF